MITRRSVLGGASGALIAAPFATFAQSPKRQTIRALIVGADYESASNGNLRLHNAVYDARLMEKSFRSTGNVEVHDLLDKPDTKRWGEYLSAYLSPFDASHDIALVYYAGHAFQREGSTYFLNEDGKTAVSADQILKFLMVKAHGILFIVDACRTQLVSSFASEQTARIEIENVAPSRGGERNAETIIEQKIPCEILPAIDLRAIPQRAGLTAMNVPMEAKTKIFYSTDAEHLASDGAPGKGGPFARVASQEFRRGRELRQVLASITIGVIDDTSKAEEGPPQTPVQHGELKFKLYIAGGPIPIVG
jgi:hypothetical protein